MNRLVFRLSTSMLLAPGAISACTTAAAPDGTAASTEAELRALHPGEIVGAIAYGQTKSTSYHFTGAESTRYRAFTFTAAAGDPLDVWVRSTTGDAKVWLLDAAFRNLASNDDAATGTHDAHIATTLAKGGTYYIALRDKTFHDADFTVTLAGGPSAPSCDPEEENCDGGAPLPSTATPTQGPPVNTCVVATGTCVHSEQLYQGWGSGVPLVGAATPSALRFVRVSDDELIPWSITGAPTAAEIAPASYSSLESQCVDGGEPGVPSWGATDWTTTSFAARAKITLQSGFGHNQWGTFHSGNAMSHGADLTVSRRPTGYEFTYSYESYSPWDESSHGAGHLHRWKCKYEYVEPN